MNTHWTLHTHQRASFATSSRLISCLTTESLLETIYIPAHNPSHPALKGIAVLLYPDSERPHYPDSQRPYQPADVFALIPLRNIPISKPDSKCHIALLDPLDMLAFIYELHDKRVLSTMSCHADVHSHCHSPQQTTDLRTGILSALSQIGLTSTTVTLASSLGPLHLWQKYADACAIDNDTKETIAGELRSSVLWQQHSYESPPPVPTFDSPSIVWEQSIIEGHPTHPMHKARHTILPIEPVNPGEYDWARPKIRLVSVPHTKMVVHGNWGTLIAPVRAAAATQARRELRIPEGHVVVPVHEQQVPNIRDKFPEAHIFPPEYSLAALAQQSLRTVLLPDVLPRYALKLALNTRVTSAPRTVSPHSASLGPFFRCSVLPELTYDPALLVMQEPASVVHAHPNPDVARHLACIMRETCEPKGERVIVCSALTEMGHDPSHMEVPLVQSVFALDTLEKRLNFFDTYTEVLLRAFLPPVVAHGVAFEAHPQNTLARFDAASGSLIGFAVRDFGGLRVHAPTLLSSTGVDFSAVPGPYSVELADVHARLYHTLVHNHLQQLVRVLGLHHTGAGWARVRRHIAVQLPADHALARLWAAPQVPVKCFLRMRMQGVCREHICSPVPNLILYEGVGDPGRDSEVGHDGAGTEDVHK